MPTREREAANTPPLAKMASRIAERVRPLRVVLFGSHARGEAHRWSDVDLLVVIADTADRSSVRAEAQAALRGFAVPTDVVVATADEVRRRGNLVGAILRPALREGKVLYASSSGPPEGRELEVGPVSDEERLATTGDWLGKARSDLRGAEMLLAASQPEPALSCYHAQQAAEKALKAVLVFLQIDYPLTHNLDDIRDAIPHGWRLKEEHSDLEWLSEWAVEARYPGGPEPSVEEAEGALAQARAVLDCVLRDLRERGFEDV